MFYVTYAVLIWLSSSISFPNLLGMLASSNAELSQVSSFELSNSCVCRNSFARTKILSWLIFSGSEHIVYPYFRNHFLWQIFNYQAFMLVFNLLSGTRFAHVQIVQSLLWTPMLMSRFRFVTKRYFTSLHPLMAIEFGLLPRFFCTF